MRDIFKKKRSEEIDEDLELERKYKKFFEEIDEKYGLNKKFSKDYEVKSDFEVKSDYEMKSNYGQKSDFDSKFSRDMDDNFGDYKYGDYYSENMYEEGEEEEKKEGFLKTLFSYVKVVVFALLISFFIKSYVISSTLVEGSSMFPTVYNKDKLIVNKVFFMKKNITRGDVIDFYVPSADKYYLKRVIAVEGDTVEIKDNRVYLNGKLLEENYVSTNVTEPHSNVTKWEVKEGYVFVLGDNRSNSTDSRDLGLIPRQDIVGKIILRYYPLNRFGGLN